MSADQVAEEYGIMRNDVLAALAYAAKVLATEQVRAVGYHRSPAGDPDPTVG